jgi:hypothetical protein
MFKQNIVHCVAPIEDEMKTKIIHHFGCRQLAILILVTLLAFEAGCASSYKGIKGKPGQVPCPCEKKSHRR